MGIKDLWSSLKPTISRASLSSFSGSRAALDVSIIVHSAVHGQASSRINGNLISTHGRFVESMKSDSERAASIDMKNQAYVDGVVDTVVNKILNMVQEGIQIYVVMDGATPPLKDMTTKSRGDAMDQAREQLRVEQERQLKETAFLLGTTSTGCTTTTTTTTATTAAASTFNDPSAPSPPPATSPPPSPFDAALNAKSIWQNNSKTGASSEELGAMFSKLRAAFRRHSIPFIVAPYEADAQLAYLANKPLFMADGNKEPAVNLVISSDSDCVPHDIPVVLKQLDSNLAGDLYKKSKRGLAPAFPIQSFTPGMMVCLSILMGCDYLPNLYMVGAKTARNLIDDSFKKYLADPRTDPPLAVLFSKLSKKGHFNSVEGGSDGYIRSFLRALVMFRHPVVYDIQDTAMLIARSSDPELECYEPYAAMVNDDELIQSLAGEVLPNEIAAGIAEGWINPKKMVLDASPDIPEDVSKAFEFWVEEGGKVEWEKSKTERREKRKQEIAEFERLAVVQKEKERRAIQRKLDEADERAGTKPPKSKKAKCEKKEKSEKKKKPPPAPLPSTSWSAAELKIRARFVSLYTLHAPGKLKHVDKVMSKYADKLPAAIEAAEQKYGVVHDENDDVSSSQEMENEPQSSMESLDSCSKTFEAQSERFAHLAQQQQERKKRKAAAGEDTTEKEEEEVDDGGSLSTNMDEDSLPEGWSMRPPVGGKNRLVDFGEGGETPSDDGRENEGEGGEEKVAMMTKISVDAAMMVDSSDEDESAPVQAYKGFN